MTELTPQQQEAAKHLDILAIFHYLVGVVAGLFACFPFVHFALGVLVVAGIYTGDLSSDSDILPEVIGWIFIIVSSVIITTGWLLALGIIYTGRCLKKRAKYTFCLVMAAIDCLFMPFGTILGVFTIVVLLKDDTKGLFTEK